MKKTIALLLLLALCMAIFAGCGEEEVDPPQDEKEYTYDDFARDAQSRTPAKITTLVNYKIGDESLNGKYITLVGEDLVTFNYSYQRYATVEEAADSRIVTTSGTAYYRNGRIAVTDGDEEPSEWAPVSPSGINVGIALEAGKSYATLNESKSVATMNLNAAQAREVLGTDLDASGNIALSITVANTYLNNVKLSYATARGAQVVVETSYTYAEGASDKVNVETAVANVAALCRVSRPTKVDTKIRQQSNNIVLNGSFVLSVGTIDGKVAATYVKTSEKLADVSSESAIVSETVSYDYIEGKGTRMNGGAWNPDGRSFIPSAGYLSLDLSTIKDAKYNSGTGTLTFLVERANVSRVLGALLLNQSIDADVTVSVSNAAGVVSAIDISYTLTYDDGNTVNTSDVVVNIHSTFSYDLEDITIQ